MTPPTALPGRPVGGRRWRSTEVRGLPTLFGTDRTKGGLRALLDRHRPPSLDQVLKELMRPGAALPTPETCRSGLDPPLTGTHRRPFEVGADDVGSATGDDPMGTAGINPARSLDAGAGSAREVIQDALGGLAASLATTGATCRPRIVQHSPRHLDVFLDPPHPTAAHGWTTDADGAVWTLGTAIPASGGAAPVPLLVPLGQPDEDGQLYLDLEAEGIVSLIGDPDTARRTLRSMIADLVPPGSEAHRVVLVGEHDNLGLSHLAQLTGTHSWDDVTDELGTRLEQSHHALVDGGWPNGFIARGARPRHHNLESVVAAAATPPPRELLRLILDNQPATVAIVVLGAAVPGATVLDCQPAQLTLADLGLVCTPPPIDPPETELATGPADNTSSPGADAPTFAARPDVQAHCFGERTTGDEPGHDIVVRFLGEIGIAGAELLTPKQTAVIAYIALHPRVTAERLEDAVWPSASPRSRRKRLANTLAECRAALGHHHLPRALDGRYVLGGGVVTDISLFDRHVEQAARESPAAAAESLREALDLLTGPAFTYRRADRASYTWVDIENWQSTWDQRISQVAQDCATIYLTLGQADTAVAVARRAHRSMPADSSLTECLMRAQAASGDRAAVQAVYQAHLAAVHNLDVGDVDQSTTELRDHLCQRKAR